MPRRYKKKTKKRSYRRSGLQMTRQLRGPASKSQMATLTYSEQISLDPGVGLVATATYNAGGMWDPRIAIGGNQPRGFDEWMSFYEHFVVVGSKIKVTFQTTGLQPSDGNGIVGILLKANPTAVVNNIPQLIELGSSNHKPVGPVGGYNSTAMVTKTYSAKKFLGRTNVLSDPQLKGSVAADPTESAYYEIVVGPSNNGDNLGAVRALIEIEYIAVFIEPKPLPQS